MIVEHRGARPSIDSSATIAPGAIISGDIVIGPHTVVLAGAIITAQGAPVQIGERCVIMENAIIRGAGTHPCTIADHVLIGPHAHISGASIGQCCFIATGAVIFNGSIIEAGSVVAVRAIVHIATYCPPSTFIPIGYIGIGNPARIYPPSEAPAVHKEISSIGFTKTVFGFDSANMTDAEATKALCMRYTRALSRHRKDRVMEYDYRDSGKDLSL